MNKLAKYNKKRDFNITDEPKGKSKKNNKELLFVVQHHMASREHYDLRLEFEGTLKSWAIPKGPSFNPEDKRLAVEVEDHPIDYKDFEGTIPKGNYGGGTVMIWDEGIWLPINNPKEDFNKGSIKFILAGKRLKGSWSLAKMQDNQWLLKKEKDNYAKRSHGISKFKTSIRTNRTMKEIENAN